MPRIPYSCPHFDKAIRLLEKASGQMDTDMTPNGVNAVEGDLSMAVIEIERARTINDELRSSMKRAEDDLINAEHDIDAKDALIKRLEEDLEERDDTIKELRSQIQDHEYAREHGLDPDVVIARRDGR